MKIGIVCYPTFGGSGVVATELGLALANKGHQVHFITYKRPVRLVHFHENIYYHEVAEVKYPLFEYAPYDSALASKMVDVVKYEDLDLLHVHYAIPHAAVAYMAKKILIRHGKYIPVVTTLHGTDITLVGADHSFAPIVEFSINKSDGITAVSQFLKEKTEEYFNIEKNIKVIYNFIDFNRFKKSNKDHFKKAIAPNNEVIVAHTSNFRKVKRVQDAVKVFKRIAEEIPAKMLMIGDGPERTACEELSRSLGIGGDIRFLGKQEAVEELLAISDIFLLPSGNESFGLAALEAMACEVPVISSNVGGLPEVNIHGETGFLSEIGDIDSMAKFALKILQNPDLLADLRHRAKKQAERFNLDIILPHYESFYQEVIELARSKV